MSAETPELCQKEQRQKNIMSVGRFNRTMSEWKETSEHCERGKRHQNRSEWKETSENCECGKTQQNNVRMDRDVRTL